MLTQGLDHVAVITNDSDRLQAFYTEMFGATVEFDGEEFPGGPRMTVINIGPATELNVFEIDGNAQADHQTPMFGRGRLDHIGLHAATLGGLQRDPLPAHRGRGHRRQPSPTSAASSACSSGIPTAWSARCWSPTPNPAASRSAAPPTSTHKDPSPVA